MKKIAFIVTIMIISISFFQSCKKEENELINKNNGKTLFRQHNNFFIENYTGSNGKNKQILVFENGEDYQDVIKQLVNRVIEADDNFLNEHRGLTDDEIFEVERETGYSMYNTLFDYLDEIGFTYSLLPQYVDMENQWLQNDMNDNLDPDDFYGLEIEEMTLLNQDRAIKVRDGKVYKIVIIYPDGYLIIEDGNTQTLNTLSQADNLEDAVDLADKFTNVSTHLEDNSCGDSSNKEKHKYQYSSKKRIKGLIKYRPRIFVLRNKAKIVAKTKSFKKCCWVWWRYRTRIKVAISGDVKLREINDNCDLPFTFDPGIWNYEKRKSMVKIEFRNDIPNIDPSYLDKIHVFDNKLYGVYFVHNNNLFNQDAYDGDIN